MLENIGIDSVPIILFLICVILHRVVLGLEKWLRKKASVPEQLFQYVSLEHWKGDPKIRVDRTILELNRITIDLEREAQTLMQLVSAYGLVLMVRYQSVEDDSETIVRRAALLLAEHRNTLERCMEPGVLAAVDSFLGRVGRWTWANEMALPVLLSKTFPEKESYKLAPH